MEQNLVIEKSFSHIVLIGDGNRRDPTDYMHRRLPLYTPVDLAFFESSEGLQKSNDALKRIGSKFKFYIDVRPKGPIMGAHPDVSAFIKQDVNNGLHPVVFNNNMSPLNHMPMTAWILLHRIPHTLILTEQPAYEGLENLLAGYMVDDYVRSRNWSSYGNYAPPLKMKTDTLKRMMTMRSARTGILGSIEDVVGELFAQHFMGGIKLQPSLYPGDYLFNEHVDALQHQLQEFIERLYNRLVSKEILAM